MSHVESILLAFKAAFMAAIMQSFGVYSGATLIAIVAAAARLAYSKEQASIKFFWKFFVMSLSLTMIMVHIGKQQGFDRETIIIISGVAAFMAREVLQMVLHSKGIITQILASRFK